jgi:hypothetical protein
MDMTIETASNDMLSAAHKRRIPFVALGKKNEINPVRAEDTSGQAGMIQAYSHENSMNIYIF